MYHWKIWKKALVIDKLKIRMEFKRQNDVSSELFNILMNQTKDNLNLSGRKGNQANHQTQA